MSDDAPPNPKPFRLAEGAPVTLQGDGKLESIWWPSFEEEAPEGGVDVEQVLDLLMSCKVSTARIGERAVLLSYLMPRCISRPKTLRELGSRLGCSHVAARDKLTKLKREFAEELADFSRQP